MAGAASRSGEGRLGVVHLLLLHGARGRHSVPLHQDVLLQGEPLSRGGPSQPVGRRQGGTGRAGRGGAGYLSLWFTQFVAGRPRNAVGVYLIRGQWPSPDAIEASFSRYVMTI